jgi:uncharacterized protein with NRDE domain
MCTVTFIPTKDAVFLTSNRDEKRTRKPACGPMAFLKSACSMIYPQDGDAGGTWIALCSNGNAGVLLNGAFENHVRKEQYNRSRGLVFLEILDSTYPLRNFLKTSLVGIEPFTLILWEYHNLYECRWDEMEKHIKPLKACQPYIWSSATLYNAEVRRNRECWFHKFLTTNPAPTQDKILRFHHTGGGGNEQENLLMNRHNKVFTVSITSIMLAEGKANMLYTDVRHQTLAMPDHQNQQQLRA